MADNRTYHIGVGGLEWYRKEYVDEVVGNLEAQLAAEHKRSERYREALDTLLFNLNVKMPGPCIDTFRDAGYLEEVQAALAADEAGDKERE